MLRLTLALIVAVAAVGCHQAKTPELRVIGMQEERVGDVVYVQVTNPASRPMRLTKLEYRFASSHGSTVSEGEVALSREVPAGAAVVVEVPLDSAAEGATQLRGKLIAEQDHMTKSFKVSADIRPAQ